MWSERHSCMGIHDYKHTEGKHKNTLHVLTLSVSKISLAFFCEACYLWGMRTQVNDTSYHNHACLITHQRIIHELVGLSLKPIGVHHTGFQLVLILTHTSTHLRIQLQAKINVSPWVTSFLPPHLSLSLPSSHIIKPSPISIVTL